ncbi:hypothetical protein, partial [Flagellimonas allohymeniacidonis]
MSIYSNPMKKCIILIVSLLFSGFAFSQTTVTLQDQCNCEVLKGTAVFAPGSVTPAGADAGDIYVNTSTGTIFFWDGDSWELTSTDDQQLQNFTFNGVTNILSLEIEDGNIVSVDLSALGGTDDDITGAALDAPTNVLTISEGATDVTVNLSDLDDSAGVAAN